MSQEEKDLLLKDLSYRLFNKVMIYLHTSSEMTGSSIVLNSSIYGLIEDVLNNSPYEIKEIKPYLRSMSSMNEEEKKEFTHIASWHMPSVEDIYEEVLKRFNESKEK